MTNLQAGRPYRILLLERDASVRELINEVLVEADYQVQKHGPPLDLAKVPDMQPDLIILDVPTAGHSPVLDDLTHLKSDAYTHHIPILALCNAKPSDDIPAWTRQMGIAGALLKPFELDELLDAVQAALETADITTLAAQYESPMHQMDSGILRPQSGPLQQSDMMPK